MQQGCCDMYGLSVEKSLIMRMSSDLMEPMELMHHVSSNERSSPIETCSGDEDGNSCENNPNQSPPTSCENSIMEESKTKKRRKQSNPLRYQTASILPLLENEDGAVSVEDEQSDEALDLQTTKQPVINNTVKSNCSSPFLHHCHHCTSVFESEDQLRVHVEEEHVQKALERQLQQQQSYNKTTSSNSISRDDSNESSIKENSSKGSDMNLLQQIIPLDQTRNSPPDVMGSENREYKHHFPFPPMPPYIPFSRSDESKPGSLPVPLSMFPNHMAPFLFPVMPPGQTPPSSNGNSHSGQGVRIFNLEAYCELCNKEFCNKYFLKTHKANKHGIYSVDSIVSSPYGTPYLSPSMNSPIPLPHILPSPNSEPMQPRSTLLNMESYCEICQKEFCNKYFLKKHRQKIHGIIEPGMNISPSTTPSQDTKSNSPVMTTSALSLTTVSNFVDRIPEDARDTSSAKMEFPSLFNIQNHKSNTQPIVSSTGITSLTNNSIYPMSAPITTSSNLPSPGNQGSTGENSVPHVFTPEKLREMGVINADAFCELCCKEFCNKYFLRTHKLNKHGINMPEVSPGKGQSGSMPPSSQNHGSQSSDKDFNFDDSHNSEGLLIDHTQGFAFDSISGEMSCEFCNRPFSSLYLLKMHKFYTHNIPYIKEEGKSKPNSPSEETSNQENKENEFVKPHLPLPLPPTSLFSDNIPTSLQEDAASQDLQKLQSMIRELNASAGSESSKIICNLCRLEFDNKYFLRAHMMNEHGVLPNEDGHVPGHNNSDFSVQSKLSEMSEFQKLNFGNSSPSVDSEAYCEICQKEFCSKYFLKTHKQNIHGLPVDMSSTPKKSLADEVCQIKSIVNNTLSSSLLLPPNSRSLTPTASSVVVPLNSQASATNLSPFSSINSHIPVITTNNSILPYGQSSSPSSTSIITQPSPIPCISLASSIANSNSTGNTILTPSSITTNGFTLSNSIHTSAINHMSSNLSIPKISPLPALNASLNLSISSSCTASSNLTSIAQMSAHLPNLHPSNSPLCSLEKPRNLTGRNYCNICNKELCNKYFMKTHMLKMHGINLDSQPHEAARISTIGGVQCDICQKELCSKYFLKVHKQNTHGIFEEGAQGKEIRDHPSFLDKEQPLQGLDLSDPSGRYFSHYPEICPVCNCRFKSIKWLKAHMISDHGNILKENFSHNAQPLSPETNNNVNSIDTSSCLCVLCGQGFPDKVALHVHLIKDHHSPSDEAGVVAANNNNSGNKHTSSAANDPLMIPEQARVNGTASPESVNGNSATIRPPHPKLHGGSRIYHCSFCVYSTRWLSNLYAHEKRHTGVNTEGEKKFVCRVCHRAYRYNHSLQRHFLSHRAAGLNLKDMAQPLIMTSHASHNFSVLSRPWNSHFHRKDPNGKTIPGSKIKRYRCSKCSKKFRSRELCLAHIHSAHSAAGQKRGGPMLQKSAKPFRCRFCGFLTRVWNVLRIHINRQHHNELISESVAKQQQIQQQPHPANEDKQSPAEVSSTAVANNTTTEDGSTMPSISSPKHPGIPDLFPPGMPPPPPNSPHLPMTFAMPQNPPSAGSFIMQPFLLAQPECEGMTTPRNGTFVPSLVYLPVCQKVSQPMTVAFTLTPA